jgi:hypothetical protein
LGSALAQELRFVLVQVLVQVRQFGLALVQELRFVLVQALVQEQSQLGVQRPYPKPISCLI